MSIRGFAFGGSRHLNRSRLQLFISRIGIALAGQFAYACRTLWAATLAGPNSFSFSKGRLIKVSILISAILKPRLPPRRGSGIHCPEVIIHSLGGLSRREKMAEFVPLGTSDWTKDLHSFMSFGSYISYFNLAFCDH